MEFDNILPNENQRIEALYKLNILGSEPEEKYDRITRIAHFLFSVQSAYISFVDRNRVWFKSQYSCQITEEPRDGSVSAYAISQNISSRIESRIIELDNTNADLKHFDKNEISGLGAGNYNIGFVLLTENVHKVGILCLIDSKARSLTEYDKKLFCGLGILVEAEFNRYPISNILEKYPELNENELLPTLHLNKLLQLSDKLSVLETKFTNLLKNYNVKYVEWRILNEIVQYSLVSPQHISHTLVISPSLVSNYLEILEKKGYLIRKHLNKEEGDRRVVQLECTELGQSVWRSGFIAAGGIDINLVYNITG